MRRIAAFLLMLPALLLAGSYSSSPSFAGGLPDSMKSTLVPPDSASAEPQVILYYFHRTSRCHTCLGIEANINEALQTYFPEQLKDGCLLWHPTNIEEPENAHFIEDFSLESNAAILVLPERGTKASWMELEEVWDLVESKGEFLEYVREHVAAALEGRAVFPDSVKAHRPADRD